MSDTGARERPPLVPRDQPASARDSYVVEEPTRWGGLAGCCGRRWIAGSDAPVSRQAEPRQRVRVELHDAGVSHLWSDALLERWLAEAISACGHDLP